MRYSILRASDKPSSSWAFFLEHSQCLLILYAPPIPANTVESRSPKQTIVATAVPKITDEFHDLSDVSWYGAAFFMTIASFQATWGKAYKFFPLKTTFLFSIFLFELGSLVCAVALAPQS